MKKNIVKEMVNASNKIMKEFDLDDEMRLPIMNAIAEGIGLGREAALPYQGYINKAIEQMTSALHILKSNNVE